MRKDKEQMTNNNRQLTEKVSYLEKDLNERKQENENQRTQYQNKIIEG